MSDKVVKPSPGASLAGLNVLIVGASGDIGSAICAEFAERGSRVVGTFCSRGGALESQGGGVQAVRLDVTDSESWSDLEALLKSDFIPDVFVYCSGINRDMPLLGMEDEDWDRVMEVNLRGAFRITRLVARYMSFRRGGKIFLVSSVASSRGGRGQANYAASKAGLEAMGRSLSTELARKEILVNSISPGVVESTMSSGVMERAGKQVLDRITLGRLGKPVEIARFVAALSDPGLTWFTGQTFCIDGGFR